MRIEFKICPGKKHEVFSEDALNNNVGKEVPVHGWVGATKGTITDVRVARGGREAYLGVELQGKPDADGEFRTPGQYKAEREEAMSAVPPKGRTANNRKKVRIVETGQVYPSQAACARAIGGSQSGVQACLAGRTRGYKGYSIQYVSEEE